MQILLECGILFDVKKISKQMIRSTFSLKNIGLFFVLIMPSVFVCPNYGFASFFYLTTSQISIENNTIKLDLYLNITTIDEVEKTIKNGASIEISCNTNLLRKQFLFSNIGLENLAKVWLLQYDPLTREFLLWHDTKLVQRNKDINILVDSIFFPLVLALDNKKLEAQIPYSIDVQLNLRQAQIPAWIEKTLFFWDWNLMSASYTFDFILPQNYEVKDAT